MTRIELFTVAATALLLAGPAHAYTCAERIADLERLLDVAASQAISASSGGQAVAGAREAQAMAESDEGDEAPVPFQDEADETAAIEETDAAGDGGEELIEARTALQGARDLAESGDEDACVKAVDNVILSLIQD
ncbi:hypothetical protein [Aurantimonas endophytica]|uniref:Uncharacterized protein n=1 Tax=Aurantimonas endophytica TaxID=1522175 RepID=A0A7W6MR49_9HYPH|nr:hypothetical protein [Aurantimonas endophytica]MBB4004639.1 hypothetical protein [Aurantimonas endophytica]MCO6405469.1 hypothetical protein [Aurantimonas endophytica]